MGRFVDKVCVFVDISPPFILANLFPADQKLKCTFLEKFPLTNFQTFSVHRDKEEDPTFIGLK